MVQPLQKAKAVKDDSGHWYVIPADMADVFDAELEDEDLVDSGGFDANWGQHMTGGDLNLVQLWAKF